MRNLGVKQITRQRLGKAVDKNRLPSSRFAQHRMNSKVSRPAKFPAPENGVLQHQCRAFESSTYRAVNWRAAATPGIAGSFASSGTPAIANVEAGVGSVAKWANRARSGLPVLAHSIRHPLRRLDPGAAPSAQRVSRITPCVSFRRRTSAQDWNPSGFLA